MVIDSIVKEIREDRMFNKYILNHTWTSGSSTVVYPVMINHISKEVIFQINTDKKIFDKFILRVCNKYKSIKSGYFWKSDGSCPSYVKFNYTDI